MKSCERCEPTVESWLQPDEVIGNSREVEAEIRDAITHHVEGMREDGIAIPEPQSQVEYIEVAA